MKFLLMSLTLFLTFWSGCKNKECNPISPPIDDRVSFEINFLHYSDNHYFIDKIYTDTSSQYNIYNRYYGEIVPTVTLKYFVKDIEVYLSVNTISQSLNSIIAYAYINLLPRSYPSLYSDSLRNNTVILSGQTYVTRFRLLNNGSDYLFNSHTGKINFLFPVKDQDIIAVAYRVENANPTDSDDLIYGEFMSDLVNNSRTKGVLKLIKPSYLQPEFVDAWKLKMKNIYQINPSVGAVTNLDLDIYLKKSDGFEVNTINNVRLLELFGFDKFKESGDVGADGKFDYRSGFTFEPQTSEIIFPVIQPFGNNIPYQLSQFKYQAIYDSFKTYLTLPGNSFVIKGKYKPI